ncbi:phosphate-starvation-inducible PsiE family protein [Halarcobacter anaerophilus]|uniref:phosphate-starvation-inducible PsiE family protein n=1 Tax=Halarcobacter anaerophilus TaxID=877500 RepID=UPI0005C966C5|nr:phosphate-starvation-inducible PsiE family protein [Halarcobacter anaerophilus]
MKKLFSNIKEYFSNNYEVLAAAIIFTIIIVAGFEFYKTIVLMLEFIVVMEVVKMISDFIKKQKLRLRFVIDIFIIFLIRDVIINTSYPNKDYFTILFLLFVIFVFFIFRILAIKYSPGVVKLLKNKKEEND